MAARSRQGFFLGLRFDDLETAAVDLRYAFCRIVFCRRSVEFILCCHGR